jgi:protoporphyrinogen/coproporphyrinogen III oxidase
MSDRTIVVGAGLSGLAAAYALFRAGKDAVVLERSQRPGGVVRTERIDGFLLETGPNTVRSTPELRYLAGELGIADQMLFSSPAAPRFVDFRGRLHRLPSSPGAFVASRLLSPRAKLRLLAEPFQPRGTRDEESVRDFFARRLGNQVADRLVEPFVAGIFAGSASRLEAAAAFPTLVRWDRGHGSLVRGAFLERRARAGEPAAPRGLVSFRDGLETLPRALARALGQSLRPATPALGLERRAGRWVVRTPAGDFEGAAVLLASPASIASDLVRGVSPEAADALDAIPHPPLAVLHLAWETSALARPLEGFGHLVVPDPERRILGAVWSSSLFAGRAPEGFALLTVFLGGARDPEILESSDDELAAIAARDLEAQGVTRGSPRVVMTTRWERSIPQYEAGHRRRMAALDAAEAELTGLRFLGSYRGGVSVGDVLKNALTPTA